MILTSLSVKYPFLFHHDFVLAGDWGMKRNDARPMTTELSAVAAGMEGVEDLQVIRPSIRKSQAHPCRPRMPRMLRRPTARKPIMISTANQRTIQSKSHETHRIPPTSSRRRVV